MDDPLFTSGSDATAAAAVFGVLGVITLLSYVISAFFMGLMFKKAGVAAWKAWVPVYNAWVFLELGEQKGWLSLLLLLALIPFVGLIPAIVVVVFMCIAAYKIGLNFGKEGWFVLLYIFATPVWLIWLAVDKTAVWQSDKPDDGNNINPLPPAITPTPEAPRQPTSLQ